MEEVSNLLRQRREELGLSIQDAQAATKIRMKYLQALEAGDENAFPGEVYLKGFLRSYAEYLGLDGWDLVRQYTQVKQDTGGIKKSSISAEYPKAIAPRRSWSWGPSVLFTLFLLAALILVIIGRDYFMQAPVEAPIGDDEPGTEQPVDPPTPIEPPDEEPEPEREVVVEQTLDEEKNAVFEVTADLLVVEVTFIQNCWLRLTIDGVIVDEMTVTAGERRTWQGSSEIKIFAGNPDGIGLTINGESVGRGSTHGVPRTITIEAKPRG